MSEIDRTIELWDTYGAGYDAALTEANHEVARVALELAGLEPGMSVLDVAAGSGALSIPAARMGADVLATDISAGMLELLRERAAREGLDGIATAVMDGTDLQVGDRRFDLVCSQYGVMFFPEQGLPEMRRVVAAGGATVVIIWAEGHVSTRVFNLAIERALPDLEMPPFPWLVERPSEIEHMLAEAGFRNVELHRHAHGYPATSPEDVWRLMETGGPGYAALLGSLDREQRKAVQRETLAEAEALYGADFEELPMASLIAIGRA